MLVDHYPVNSIRSLKISWLKNQWGKKIISIGGKQFSLNDIEHDILMGKLKEPMAHFAIVCASLSCPELSADVYEAAFIKAQMEKQARIFLKDKVKGLRIDRSNSVVYFSKIFKFDSKTFPAGAKDAITLITSFVNKEDAIYLKTGSYRIKYLDYDWSANDLKRLN